jgi:hypothetical protein
MELELQALPLPLAMVLLRVSIFQIHGRPVKKMRRKGG